MASQTMENEMCIIDTSNFFTKFDSNFNQPDKTGKTLGNGMDDSSVQLEMENRISSDIKRGDVVTSGSEQGTRMTLNCSGTSGGNAGKDNLELCMENELLKKELTIALGKLKGYEILQNMYDKVKKENNQLQFAYQRQVAQSDKQQQRQQQQQQKQQPKQICQCCLRSSKNKFSQTARIESIDHETRDGEYITSLKQQVVELNLSLEAERTQREQIEQELKTLKADFFDVIKKEETQKKKTLSTSLVRPSPLSCATEPLPLSSAKKHPPSWSSASSRSDKQADNWPCPTCTYINSGETFASKCSMCSTIRRIC